MRNFVRNKTAFFLMSALILFPSVCGSALAAEQGYIEKLGATFTRGVKNVITAPYEIPYTMGVYDRKDDGTARVIRNTAGFFDGIFRTVTRLGCGAWDMGWAFIPGDQQGLPLEPEAFF